MHRSGTSAATGVLSRLGLATCTAEDLLDRAPGNSKGHFESVSMIKLNEALLAEMGRSWWCPPRSGADFEQDASRITVEPDDARAAFDAVHPVSPFVWKDPRTAITLPFWRRALQRNLAFVVLVRSALDVAVSLHRRDGLRLTHGVALWERYNRHILANLAGAPAIVTRYDDLVDDPARWCEEVVEFLSSRRISCALAPEAELRRFVEPSMRHQSTTRAELLSSYASCAALHDALESSVGTWPVFESPRLPPESPWVEAELAAIGCWQPEPLPRPSPPVVSTVVVTERVEAQAAAASLAGQLLPFMDAVLVVRGASDPDDDAALAGFHPRLSVRAVPAGTPLGAARGIGVAAASAQIVEFRSPFARASKHWPPELRRAMAAGYAAVSPAVRRGTDATGYGLEVTSPTYDRRWLGRPDDGIATVGLLAAPCFALRRDVLEQCGGFDELIGSDDLDTHELSLRLQRFGHRVAVARDAPLECSGALLDLDGSGEPDAVRYLHDLVRLAAVHASSDHLARLLDALDGRPGLSEALGAVLTSDAALRRRALGGGPTSATDLARGARGGDGPRRLVGQDGPSQPHPRPRRVEEAVSLSIVVAGPDAGPACKAAERLAYRLDRPHEVLTGAGRAAAARQAGGAVLLFAEPDALPDVVAAERLLQAVTGELRCAAGPALLPFGRRTHPRGALRFDSSLLDPRWAGVAESCGPVQALSGAVIAIPAPLYEEIGGYDEALEGSGWADVELSLRLWRHDASCLLVPDALVALPASWCGRSPLHGDDALFGLLRLAAVHLEAADHSRLIALVSGWRGFPAAIARVASSDVGLRRRSTEDTASQAAGTVLRRWCGEDWGQTIPAGGAPGAAAARGQ